MGQNLPQGIAAQTEVFRCPLCAGAFSLVQRSLVCGAGHSFDLARSGYVNLLRGKTPPVYDKALFTSRAALCKAGAFAPMVQAIAAAIVQWVPKHLPARLMDAGCGEGSHLHQVLEVLSQQGDAWQGAGIDIAKEGVLMASKAYPHAAWCVGDLAHSPFADGAFGAILSILSPSNYQEFTRMLAPGGVLIKIVPGADYLAQLRGSFYEQGEKSSYSNQRVVSLFEEAFEPLVSQPIRYQAPIAPGMLADWIAMTPLSHHVPQQRIDELLAHGLGEMTVDLLLLAGRRKG